MRTRTTRVPMRIAFAWVLLAAMVILGACSPNPTPMPASTLTPTPTDTPVPPIATGAAFQCGVVTEIPQSECKALMALYTSANGEKWRNMAYPDLGTWLTTRTPCQWYGVTCEDRHVTLLRLGINQLSGSIPPELGNLTNLTILDLGVNQLTGSIPPELGNLTKLTRLDLGGNQLTGGIPPELGKLANLTMLTPDHNRLTGSIPPDLGNLTELKLLNLNNNQLTGSVPPELCRRTLDPSNRLDLEIGNNQVEPCS